MAIAIVGSQQFAAGGTSGEAVYSAYNGVEYTSSYGNGLIIIGAYDLAPATAAPLPFMTPCDSAGNLYYPLGQLPAEITNASQSRLAAWYCPNARPITWASISVGTIASASITGIYEFSGMPAWCQLSMTTLYAGGTGTAPSIAGPSNGASFAIGLVATSTTTATLTNTGAGWTTVTQETSGATNGVTAQLSWLTTSSSGTITYAPTISVSSPYTVMLAAFTLAPVAPSQPNTSYPRFIYEAQFGRDVGDLQTAPYSPGPAIQCASQQNASGTTVTNAYTVAVQGSSTLLANIVVPAAATITLSDDAGNSYTQLSATNIPGGGVSYVFDVVNNLTVTTANNLTFTQSVAQASLVSVVSVTGVWQLDVSKTATGTSTAPSIGTGALGSQMDYELFVFANNSTVHASATLSGFETDYQIAQGALTSDMYSRVSTPGVGFNANGAGDTCTSTYGSSVGWAASAITYKAVGWTDISAYVVNGAMGQTMKSTQGRPYELSQPEAGELQIRLDDHASQFFANNTSSPFYPGVLVECPVRVTCISDSRQYPVGSGYVDQWPLEWPELPQWTFTSITATDTMELLNNANLPSGVQCEIRNDYPFVYIPGNEQYSNQVTSTSLTYGGLNNTKQPNECSGFIAANASLYNQRSAFYSDGGTVFNSATNSTAQIQTGLSIGYAGSSDTGFGQSGYTAATSYPNAGYTARGPGLTYVDPLNLPAQTNVTSGMTLEWCCEVPGQGSQTGPVIQDVTLFEAVSQPSAFQTVTNGRSAPDLTIYTNNPSTTVMEFWLQTKTNSTAISAAYTPSKELQGSLTPTLFHCALTIQNGTATLYLNGVAQTPQSVTLSGAWTEFRLGGARGRYGAPPRVFNYVMGNFALYPYVLPVSRIQAHYNMSVTTGLPQPMGTESISTYDYSAAALAYSRVPAQAAGPGAPYLADVGQIGPMYSVSNSTVGDVINTATQSEGGLIQIDKQCNTVILGRNAVYNNQPFLTFGDNGTTQVPYLQQSGFGYDDQFLYTIVSTQQQSGSSQGIDAVAQNFGGSLLGQVQYGNRNAPIQQVQVDQANDAIDQTNWKLNKYSAPSIRSKSIVVDAASLVGTSIDTAFSSQGGIVGALMSCNLGTIVSVTRTPLGGVNIAETGIIEQVSITSGPSLLEFEFVISPYNTEGDILQTDNTNDGTSGQPVNQLGYGALAW